MANNKNFKPAIVSKTFTFCEFEGLIHQFPDSSTYTFCLLKRVYTFEEMQMVVISIPVTNAFKSI
jgi:hypothetical protein